MIAAFFLERDPLRFQDLPTMCQAWAQDAGGFAAVAVILWLLFGLPRLRAMDWKQYSLWQSRVFSGACLACLACYLTYGILRLPELFNTFANDPLDVGYTPSAQSVRLQGQLLTWGGLFALLAAGTAFLRNLTRLRIRRIGAVALLSFKEAVRRRVLYVFGLFLIVFLFANWYVPAKPEDQVRTYVGIVYYAMGPLLLTAALILGAFSIPNDINQHTIHTILTKPVERFEVVLGRFLGFVAILSVMLVVMTTLGLVYVIRNVDPAAAEESLKAREPIYGVLTFEPGNKSKAESVGREWEYRSYISGPTPGKPAQAAIWSFDNVPAKVAERAMVPCEFTFDIYRTTKGSENKGVSCVFVFTTWHYRPGNEEEWRRRKSEVLKRNEREVDPDERKRNEREADNALGKELGYYEIAGKDVTDFHTQSLELPGGLFVNARNNWPPRLAAGQTVPAPLRARVTCESSAQMVGMARYDLYLRLDDPDGASDRLWFAWNFYKGAAGLWFALVLLCGLTVSLSTYLSGVIGLLMTGLLYLGGMFQDFIKTVGEGSNVGGGPLEAMYRIASRTNTNVPLEENAAIKVATGSDQVFRWMVRRVLDVLPDVDRYSLTPYVAEGFNIPGAQLLVNLVILAGYLLPWAVLAFYLIRWREIAAQT